MSKLTLIIGTLLLAGCASTGGWRSLSIDGTSESAFRESVTQLDDELSSVRREMFRIALIDIAQTGVLSAGETDDGGPAYDDADFRAELDGLTYEAVIALADQSGTPVNRLYYSSLRAPIPNMPAPTYGGLPGPAPTFRDNGLPNYGPFTLGWPVPGGETVAIQPDQNNGF